MSRRLWYRDSYGRWHEDCHAQGRSGVAGEMDRDHVMVLAGFIVIASIIH